MMEPLDVRATEPDPATSASQPSTPIQSPKQAMQSPPPLAIKRRPPSFKPLLHPDELAFSQTLSDQISNLKLQTLEEQFEALMRDSSSCQSLTDRTLFAFREDQMSGSDDDCYEYQSIEAEESNSEVLFRGDEVALEDVMREIDFRMSPLRDRKRGMENDSVKRKQKRIKDAKGVY